MNYPLLQKPLASSSFRLRMERS